MYKGRKMDAAVLRQMAVEIGWDEIDPDILDQADAGFESHSACSLTTVLAFHHTGMALQYEVAAKVIEADIGEGWVTRAVRWLPRVPIRVLPRNVIVTDKARVAPDGVSLEHFKKGRVSTDAGESKSDDSPNSGTPKADTALELCTAQDMGVGTAIVAIPSGGLTRTGIAVIDLESAFRFCCLQWLELWLHAFLWWTASRTAEATEWASRRAGVSVDGRVDFGGSTGPNRFQRVMLLVRAFIAYKLRQFDISHPLPPLAREWQADRRALQSAGLLPPAAAQSDPTYVQVYLDDLGLAGGTDIVEVPAYLDPIVIGGVAADSTLDQLPIDPTTGGRPTLRECRIHVYCLLAVWELLRLKFSCSLPKTAAAWRAIVLGLRIRPADNIIDCPELKAKVMLEALATLRATVEQHRPIRLDMLEVLVGRLGNISQIYCAIRLWIAAGYALVRLRYRTRALQGARPRYVKKATLRPGGRRATELLQLCDAATRELSLNAGITLAAQEVFPGPTDQDVAVVVTDASGIHGVGGYAMLSSMPKVVWLLSEWWQPDILLALEAAAAGATQDSTAPRFAMPAAELFGAVVIAAALRERSYFASVIAVGDCLPVARVINASSSSSAQMRHLLRESRTQVQQWLAVHIRRELNVDPDRLSHPTQYEEVRAEVLSAGWTPIRLRPSPRLWQALFEAIQLPLAVDELLPRFA